MPSIHLVSNSSVERSNELPKNPLMSPQTELASDYITCVSLEDESLSSSSETVHSEEDNQIVKKTDHKLAEERGEHAEEPLLKENPHRFVLFPIQDDDVRSFSCCLLLSLVS